MSTTLDTNLWFVATTWTAAGLAYLLGRQAGTRDAVRTMKQMMAAGAAAAADAAAAEAEANAHVNVTAACERCGVYEHSAQADPALAYSWVRMWGEKHVCPETP